MSLNKLKLENFDYASYSMLTENEDINIYREGFISEKQDNIIQYDSVNISTDFVCRFYITTISVIGLYMFYKILKR
jgi:hypothetical protein